MPQWLISLILNYVVPMAVAIIKQFGLPALEQKFPQLIPLLQELLNLLAGPVPPTDALHLAAAKYNEVIIKKA